MIAGAGGQFVLGIVIRAVDETSRALASAGKGIKGMRGNLASLEMRMKAGRMQQQDFNDRWGETLQLSRTAGIVMTAAGGAIAAGMGKAVAEYKTFGEAMGRVATMVDTNIVSMKELEAGVRSMAVETGESAEMMAGGLYQALSAGVGAGEALEFVGTAAKVAVGGATDTYTAVDGLTTVMNAWGKTAEDATDIANSMFTAYKAGKLTIAELSASYAYIAGTASAAGLSIDETNAALAAITTQGIPAQMAARGLNMALIAITQPTDEVKKAAAAMGVELSEAALKEKGLIGVMKELEQATGGSVEKMGKLMGSSMAARAALALTGSGGEKFAEIMGSMSDKAGAMDEAYGKMADTFDRRWKVMAQSIKELSLSVGEALVPMIQKATDVLIPLIQRVGEFAKTPFGKAAIIGAAGLAAMLLSIGPLLIVLPGLLSAVQLVQGAGGLAGLGAAGKAFALTLKTTVIPATWAAVAPFAALAAAIYAVVYAYKGWQKMKGIGENVKESVGRYREYFRAMGREEELERLKPTAAERAEGALMIGGVTAEDLALVRKMKEEKERITREDDKQARATFERLVRIPAQGKQVAAGEEESVQAAMRPLEDIVKQAKEAGADSGKAFAKDAARTLKAGGDDVRDEAEKVFGELETIAADSGEAAGKKYIAAASESISEGVPALQPAVAEAIAGGSGKGAGGPVDLAGHERDFLVPSGSFVIKTYKDTGEITMSSQTVGKSVQIRPPNPDPGEREPLKRDVNVTINIDGDVSDPDKFARAVGTEFDKRMGGWRWAPVGG